jgi:hypothetical protein
MVCPITNTCRPAISYGGLVHGNGPDPCSHSSLILIQTYVFIHPLPSSHFSLGTLRLQIVDSLRCTHIDVQSHHSSPSSQKRNELIRYAYLHPIHESSSLLAQILTVLERASKETKKGDRIGHSKADGFLLLLFDDTRVVGWRGGSVTVCGGERAGAIRHS